MKTSQLNKKIGTAILGLFLLLGVGIATSSTAQAQDPWGRWQQDRRDRDRDYRDRDANRNRGRRGRGDDYPNLGGSFQLRQTALNAGYNEGIKEGRKDRNRNRGYNGRNFREFNSYQRATKDYDSRYGDRSLYQQYFRMAFERGFDAGLQGY